MCLTYCCILIFNTSVINDKPLTFNNNNAKHLFIKKINSSCKN